MSNFNNFAEMAVANGTQMNSRVIAMATDGAGIASQPQAHFVQNTVTNNGARAYGFREKRISLRREKGNINLSELELDPKMEAEMGTWDEDDIAEAREYFNEVITTTRWVGKPAKARAKELLEKLDAQVYQKNLPLDYGEDANRARMSTEWAEGAQYRGLKEHVRYPDMYDKRGEMYQAGESPKAIKHMEREITKMTPVFQEILRLEAAGDTKGLKRELYDAMDRMEDVERQIRRAERFMTLEEPDSWQGKSYQSQINDAKEKISQWQDAIARHQQKIAEAEAY